MKNFDSPVTSFQGIFVCFVRTPLGCGLGNDRRRRIPIEYGRSEKKIKKRKKKCENISDRFAYPRRNTHYTLTWS